MRKIINFVAVILVAVSLLPLTSCGKKIHKVSEDDLIDRMEDIFDWAENTDYLKSEDCEFLVTNFDDKNNPYVYEADYSIQGEEYNGEWVYARVKYYILDDGDAAATFDNYYKVYADGKKNIESGYSMGNYGYYIEIDNPDCFRAMYYADDMILEVTSCNKDGIELVKQFVKELGLPV